MRNRISTLIFLILFIFLVPLKGQTCTTFCLDHGDRPVFGRNYDFMMEDGLVIINKRGVTKTTRSKSIVWTSKYGSVTFNQYGREFPTEGMNEAGLVVEPMMLVETEYPLPDSRPAIPDRQWIQYQLDNFSTIEEVIASDSQIRIIGSGGPVGSHFLVCDRTGNCATIEFIDHKLVYHTNEKMPVKTLTNSIYAESISFLERDKIPQLDKFRSVERFICAANMVKNYDPKNTKSPIDFAFRILKNVELDFAFRLINVEVKLKTQWSIVYDIKNLSIYFRTLGNQQIRHFDLKSFDLSCSTPVRVLDVQAELSGDISDEFIDYTYQINRNLVGEAFRKTPFLSHLPNGNLDILASYPDEMTSCVD